MSAVRRFRLRHRTVTAVATGFFAVLPALALSGGAADWVDLASTERTGTAGLVGGYDPGAAPPVNVDGSLPVVNVDGSLPQSPDLAPLVTVSIPEGPLGIPGTALEAYRNAAEILGRQQPACHIDWALLASIGRIESNHARGGYVDADGNTLEPILGPVLNGVGPVAAIPDTDDGRYDGDTVWDRAVGPSQFIPSTWQYYASDGNGDGESNPNNIFDASLATGRYLCSGGLDLADEDQLRAAIFRYNNSQTYVDTVIRWAEAYRTGVLSVPDSDVPIGVARVPTAAIPAPGPTAPPPEPVQPTSPAPGSGDGGESGPGQQLPGGQDPPGSGSGTPSDDQPPGDDDDGPPTCDTGDPSETEDSSTTEAPSDTGQPPTDSQDPCDGSGGDQTENPTTTTTTATKQPSDQQQSSSPSASKS